MPDQRSDFGLGCGDWRRRGLDAHHVREAMALELLQERAIARADVQRALPIRQICRDARQIAGVGQPRVVRLVRSVEGGVVVGGLERFPIRRGVRIQEIALLTDHQRMVHVLRDLARRECERAERFGIDVGVDEWSAVVRAAARAVTRHELKLKASGLQMFGVHDQRAAL